MKAAKKGDREAVVKSITELQGEEAKLRDRWAIVDKVHRDVVGNADVTFSKRGMLGMFGSGASEYADETKKVTETKAALKNSHNEVYARRSVLQNKLQQLNQAVPTKQVKLPSRVVRFEEDAGKPKTAAKVERAVEILTSPIQVTESVFK
jgi:propanediol dehydratase small subunit